MALLIPGSTEQVLECLCGFAMRGYGEECRSKYIIDGDEAVTVECCCQLLMNLNIEHPIGQILLDYVSTFHNKYGCSVRTLLCMVLVFYRSYSRLITQNIPSTEVRSSLDQISDICTSYLQETASNIGSLLNSANLKAKGTSTPAFDRVTSVESHYLRLNHEECVTAESRATPQTPITLQQKTETEYGDDFDEISWYFTPEGASNASSINLQSSEYLDKRMASVKPSSACRPSHSSHGSTNTYTHSDDDDFASCFDMVKESIPSTKKVDNNINNLDWLNRALSSIGSKPKSSPVDNCSESNSSKRAIYSRNMSAANDCLQDIPAKAVDGNYYIESSTPDINKLELSARNNTTNQESYSPVIEQSDGESSVHTNVKSIECTACDNSDYAKLCHNTAVHQVKTNSATVDLDEYLKLCAADTLMPSPSTHKPFLPLSVSSIEGLVSGISRSDDTISQLLLKTIEYLAHGGELSSSDLNNINQVRCIGPLSAESDIWPGMIVECDSEAIGLISVKSIYKSLLFQGDVDPNYTHTGYKDSVKYKKILQKSEDLVSEAKSQSWCEETFKYVIQTGVQCLLVKGRCHTILKGNLTAAGVLVLEKVGYSVLALLSEQANIPILHYVADINKRYLCDLNITSLNLHSFAKHMNHFVNINLSTDDESAITHKSMLVSDVGIFQHISTVTVVLCSPIAEQTHIMEERFRHALARMRRVILSKHCLISFSFDGMIHQLYQRRDIWSGDDLLPVVTECFIDELHYLTVQNSHNSAVDPHIDDVESIVAAWESALSAVKYLSSLNLMVRTGITHKVD